MKLSELNEMQLSHLGYRLDKHTGLGVIGIGNILKGKQGDLDVEEIFLRERMTPHQAKIHASKVINYKLTIEEAISNYTHPEIYSKDIREDLWFPVLIFFNEWDYKRCDQFGAVFLVKDGYVTRSKTNIRLRRCS